MRAVWKYELHGVYEVVEMPDNANILCVQLQHGIPRLWAEVNSDAPMTERTIVVYGTGQEVAENAKYIGTYQVNNLLISTVWHVYELNPPL